MQTHVLSTAIVSALVLLQMPSAAGLPDKRCPEECYYSSVRIAAGAAAMSATTPWVYFINQWAGAAGSWFLANIVLCDARCMKQHCYKNGCIPAHQAIDFGCVPWLSPAGCALDPEGDDDLPSPD